MSFEIKQKSVDLIFEEEKAGDLKGYVSSADRKPKPEDKILRLHFSLMGETSPQLSPMSATFAIEDGVTVYRYDWMVGATTIKDHHNWNWFFEIARERAMAIQVLVDPQDSGCSFTETNALLLGLQPSMDTASLLERNVDKLGGAFDKLADIAKPFSTSASTILKTSAIMSNFVSSVDAGGKKNWFIYRFLDEQRKCCAIEWNIHRNILHEYGPLLRGSILLAFHGTPKRKPLTLVLRPKLNFGKGVMSYSPPHEELEKTDPVALSINPVVG